MIPFNNYCREFLYVVFLIFSYNIAQCQDLYDFAHTQKYANYLFTKKEFAAAADEYKRLAVFMPYNDTVLQKILISYRMVALYDSGIGYIKTHHLSNNHFSRYVIEEYAKNVELAGEYKGADSLLWANGLFGKDSHLDTVFITKYFFYNYALSGHWDEAAELFNNQYLVLDKNTEAWHTLFIKQGKLSYKSPGLALALSAVLPGSGKIYANDWIDGLISTLTVGSMAYESYIGFHGRGARSALGWVFGGLAIGFYGGNLYGSYKSAQRYNHQKNKEIHDAAENLVAAGL